MGGATGVGSTDLGGGRATTLGKFGGEARVGTLDREERLRDRGGKRRDGRIGRAARAGHRIGPRAIEFTEHGHMLLATGEMRGKRVLGINRIDFTSSGAIDKRKQRRLTLRKGADRVRFRKRALGDITHRGGLALAHGAPPSEVLAPASAPLATRRFDGG